MTQLPHPEPVLDLMFAYRCSKAMFAAVSLGVFDGLGEGASSAATLAEKLGANRDALERLLDTCVALSLLEKADGLYSNSPLAGAYLTRSSPTTLTGYILYSDRASYPLWGNLQAAVREGTNRWGQTFGGEASLFGHFFRTDAARRDFLGGLDGFGRLCSPAVVAAFDLGRFRRLVDLGGGTGHLALAACAHYPQLEAVVFELPAAIASAREYVERSPERDRVTLIAGDFFVGPLPGADLFALCQILHDWGEEKIRMLLRKIWERLPLGGALLIAERLLNEDKTSPTPAVVQSLNMLVCTEGRERSLAEYTTLLREAGFAEIEGRITNAPFDAILAVK